MSEITPDHAPLILIADDDKTTRMALRLVMEQEGYRVVEALNGESCLAIFSRLRPDVVLLDAIMPIMDGFACCAQIQQLQGATQIPVLMITGLEDQDSVNQAFTAGAVDYITKPIHWAVLRQRVRRLIQQAKLYQQLEEANFKLQRLATVDALTQVANRRRFDEYLEDEWQRMMREQLPLSLILSDIDYFKLYNDTYGHQAGDDCLRKVAQIMQVAAKRAIDLPARYGGEEFAVILPHTEQSGALQVADEIRVGVKALEIAHARSKVSHAITVSLGVATTIPNQGRSLEMLIMAADQALYQAKEAGRDRCCTRAIK